IKTREKVSIKTVHNPRLYIKHKPIAEKIAKATFLPVIKNAAIIIMIIKRNSEIALSESAGHSMKLPKYFLIGSNKKDSISFTSSVNHSVPSAIRSLSRKIFVKESFGMIDIIALIIFIHAPFLS